MHLLVAPVSGGAFPVQLAFMIEVAKLRRNSLSCYSNILPSYDAILASSGGNIASYIALAGDFTMEGIEKVCSKLKPDLFLTSWWPNLLSFLPSWIPGCYEGSIYCGGSGFGSLFEELFTFSSIGRIEMWTGTLNRTTGKAQLFTNLFPSESKLALNYFSPDKFNAMPLTYLDRDRKTIAQATYASAAIPVLVPNVYIGTSKYADGGTCFSSPLTPLQDCIIGAIQNNPDINNEGVRNTPVISGHPDEELHIDYLSSYDLESNSRPATYKNLLENGAITLAEIIKSLGIQDRLSGIELLRAGPVKLESGACDSETLASISSRRRKYWQSMLELYPGKEIEISLEKFTPKDIIQAIHETKKCMMYRLWYVE